MTAYQPTIGDVQTGPDKRTCGFAIDHKSPTCGAPADVHLVVAYGPGDQHFAVLAACDQHVRIARAAGNLVMEHDYGGTCGMPGTRWDFRNNCCVIDDSGHSRAGRAVTAVCA